MDAVGDLVQGFGGRGRAIVLRIVDQLLKVADQQAIVRSAGFGAGMGAHLFVEEAQAEGVALFLQQVHQGRCRQGRKAQLVDVGLARIGGFGEIHGRRGVDHDLTAQVGFFLVSLGKQLVGTGVDLPVDIAGRFAGIVEAVFGEFDGKSVERALV